MRICKLIVLPPLRKLQLHKQQYRSIPIMAYLEYSFIFTSVKLLLLQSILAAS